MESPLRQPAAAPDPVGLDGVDKQGDHSGINAVGGKLGALGHGAGDDGGGGGAEHQVEDEGGGAGKAAVRRTCDEVLKVCEQIHVRQADQAEQRILAHQQGVAQQGEHDGADTKIHQVFHDDVAGVLGPGEARLHHGKAGLHPEHERSAYQKPKFYCHNNNPLPFFPYLLLYLMRTEQSCTP